MNVHLLFLTILLCASTSPLWADQIKLNNGDIISGDIVTDSGENIIVKTQAMGNVTIDKKFIQPNEEAKTEPAKDDTPKWERKILAGYSLSRGNTDSSTTNLEFNASRKTDWD